MFREAHRCGAVGDLPRINSIHAGIAKAHGRPAQDRRDRRMPERWGKDAVRHWRETWPMGRR